MGLECRYGTSHHQVTRITWQLSRPGDWHQLGTVTWAQKHQTLSCIERCLSYSLHMIPYDSHYSSSTLLLFVNKTLNSSFCKPSSLSSVYHTSIQLRIYGPFNIQPRKKQELTYIASTLCCCPMQSSPARSWRNRGKFLVNYRETGCLYSLGENELAIKAIYIFHSLNAWEAVRAFTS